MRKDIYEFKRRLNYIIEKSKLIDRYYINGILEREDTINLINELLTLKAFIDESLKGEKTNEETRRNII